MLYTQPKVVPVAPTVNFLKVLCLAVTITAPTVVFAQSSMSPATRGATANGADCNGDVCTCKGKKPCSWLEKDCIKEGGSWSGSPLADPPTGKCTYPPLPR